jgi:hypothetical protein
MPVFSLRSQRLCGEFPGVPNEPSPIFGHSVVRQQPMGSLRTFLFFLAPRIRALQRPSKLCYDAQFGGSPAAVILPRSVKRS